MESDALYQWSLLTLLILVSLQLLAGGLVILLATLQIRRLSNTSSRMFQKLTVVLEQTDRALARTVDATDNLSAWCRQVSAAAGTASSTVTEVDLKIERSLSSLKQAMARWTAHSDSLLERFSGASAKVHSCVLSPASRLSVLLRAIQTGLAHLKPEETEAPDPNDPSRYHTDQQSFI